MAKVKSQKKKGNKPSYLSGYEFTLLCEHPESDAYIVEIKGKDIKGVKLVTKNEYIGITKIHWDGPELEKEQILSLKKE